METAVTTRQPNTPGVWPTLRPGGAREWSVQVKHEIQKDNDGDGGKLEKNKIKADDLKTQRGWHKEVLVKKIKGEKDNTWRENRGMEEDKEEAALMHNKHL